MDNHRHLYIQPESEEIADLYSRNLGEVIGFTGENAGFDLICPRDIEVKSRTLGQVIDLEVCAVMVHHQTRQFGNMYKNTSDPEHFEIRPRSSMGKTPLRLSNQIGTIDAGYRNHLMIIVDNLGEDYTIKKGDRLVQVCTGDLQSFYVSVTNQNLRKEYPSQRDLGGLGSTGR